MEWHAGGQPGKFMGLLDSSWFEWMRLLLIRSSTRLTFCCVHECMSPPFFLQSSPGSHCVPSLHIHLSTLHTAQAPVQPAGWPPLTR